MKGKHLRLLLVVPVILLLELFSMISLKLIDPERLERFESIFKDEYRFHPHAFLQYVSYDFDDEVKRYRSDDSEIKAIFLGASTTVRGYPEFTEKYLVSRGLSVETFNFGVDGWCLKNSLMAYCNILKYGNPDYVVVHHNVNDALENDYCGMILVLPNPSFASRIAYKSRFLRFVMYAYHYLYGPLFGGLDFYDRYREDPGPVDMTTKISLYLHDPGGSLFPHSFFEVYDHLEFPMYDAIEGDLRDLVTMIRSHGAVPVLTTQFVDVDQFPEGKENFNRINDVIRKIGVELNVPLVDLAKQMQNYKDMMVDRCHFNEQGIRVKGELVAEVIEEIHSEKDRP